MALRVTEEEAEELLRNIEKEEKVEVPGEKPPEDAIAREARTLRAEAEMQQIEKERKEREKEEKEAAKEAKIEKESMKLEAEVARRKREVELATLSAKEIGAEEKIRVARVERAPRPMTTALTTERDRPNAIQIMFGLPPAYRPQTVERDMRMFFGPPPVIQSGMQKFGVNQPTGQGNIGRMISGVDSIGRTFGVHGMGYVVEPSESKITSPTVRRRVRRRRRIGSHEIREGA